jgi:hypothetical protein
MYMNGASTWDQKRGSFEDTMVGFNKQNASKIDSFNREYKQNKRFVQERKSMNR